MEKIQGKFFLPENFKRKKKQVEGVIHFQPDGIMLLELSGTIDPDIHPILLHSKQSERITIWGIAANGSRLTLFECQRRQIKSFLGVGGRSIEMYQVKYMMDKEWVSSTEIKFFNKLSVNISRLDKWINISGGKEKIFYAKDNSESFSYTYTQPDTVSFKINKILEGSFYFTFEKKSILHGYHLQQRTGLELASNKQQSLQFFIKKLLHFIRFLNIVCESKLEIRFIVMTSYQNFYFVKKEKYFEDLKLNFTQSDLGAEILETSNSFLIKYSEIEDSFSNIMEAWFKLESGQYSRIIQILYECIENKNRVNMHLFLAICQAVEGFYRLEKKKRNCTFEKAIKVMLDENIYNIHFHDKKVENIVDCANSIKLLRNDLTHIGKFEKKEVHKSEIHFYTTLLKNILIIALLKKVGIDDGKISICQ